jgi:hypothetical protein
MLARFFRWENLKAAFEMFQGRALRAAGFVKGVA